MLAIIAFLFSFFFVPERWTRIRLCFRERQKREGKIDSYLEIMQNMFEASFVSKVIKWRARRQRFSWAFPSVLSSPSSVVSFPHYHARAVRPRSLSSLRAFNDNLIKSQSDGERDVVDFAKIRWCFAALVFSLWNALGMYDLLAEFLLEEVSRNNLRCEINSRLWITEYWIRIGIFIYLVLAEHYIRGCVLPSVSLTVRHDLIHEKRDFVLENKSSPKQETVSLHDFRKSRLP